LEVAEKPALRDVRATSGFGLMTRWESPSDTFRPIGTDRKERTMAALGIILIIAGAIVAWGVEAVVDGFDLQAIGYILMAGGAIALLVAALRTGAWMAKSNRQMRTERHVSADGNHFVEETETH
jgi:hypothetical protein